MTAKQQETAAKNFSQFWADKGDEKQHTQQFWNDLLRNVLDIQDVEHFIEFEKRVQLTHTSFIDAYIPDAKVLIEQKGAKIDLHKAYAQSDGNILTPYQQAKRYADELPNSIRPNWIVVCNFREFLIYNMETPHAEPVQILLSSLDKDIYLFDFMKNRTNRNIQREIELSIEAGVIVGELYDELLKQYKHKDEFELKSLNMLCVRLVFCLYAEDAGIFGRKQMFAEYLESFQAENVRTALIELFRVLDQKPSERDPYMADNLAQFPYINGGLFRDERILIPPFNDRIRDFLLNKASSFDWSQISPTIFGAIFESTLNPETRRSGGMHYTSIENIHKVIDPLFLNDLTAEFESIAAIKNVKNRNEKLVTFQEKLGRLKFLDPACGSGNFLTETYISLRRLENRVITLLNKLGGGERVLGFDDFIKVHIEQFYGIEINDFAVTVAKTALWIAESQMIGETEEIIIQTIEFLPLTTNASIVEGNALRMDWATLQPLDAEQHKDSLFSAFTTVVDGTAHQYDYIMGNPPFVGARLMTSEQKNDLLNVFGKNWQNIGNMDYVCGWYKKAFDLIKGTPTNAALVSTNSISQGEQVANLWKTLVENGLQIDFAYRTFRWDSESTLKAHVHCVIVGFSCTVREKKLESKTNGKSAVVARDDKFYKGHYLPHWHKDGAIQFITFRLDDSLPQAVLKEIQEAKDDFEKQNPKPWNDDVQEKYHKKFTDKIEKYLESGYGSCILAKKEFQKPLIATLLYDNEKKYKLHSFVIMPNHIHILVEMLGKNELCEIVKQWKGISARRINQLQNKTGTIWQSDYFDRMIRNEEHYKNVLNYIENNKAEGAYHWRNTDDVAQVLIESKTDGKSNLYYNGKSAVKPNEELRIIFDEGGTPHKAANINPYLIDAPNVFVESRSKPLCDVPQMDFGNMPNDAKGMLSNFSAEEKNALCKKYPELEKIFHKLLGAEEYINNKERWSLWFKDADLSIIRKIPEIKKRVEKVREARAQSKRDGTRKLADYPYLFGEIRQPETNYIIVPRVSSEKRKYIPMGFLSPEVIVNDSVQIIPNATLYEFGILTSNVHMAWTRAVCGRLEMRYRYSKDIVYNNFIWPSKLKIENGELKISGDKKLSTVNSQLSIKSTAQAILDARDKYPDCSLADLYDENTMPPDLRKAHRENDKAVMAAYGFDYRTMTESECVARLFEMYERLVKGIY